MSVFLNFLIKSNIFALRNAMRKFNGMNYVDLFEMIKLQLGYGLRHDIDNEWESCILYHNWYWLRFSTCSKEKQEPFYL